MQNLNFLYQFEASESSEENRKILHESELVKKSLTHKKSPNRDIGSIFQKSADQMENKSREQKTLAMLGFEPEQYYYPSPNGCRH